MRSGGAWGMATSPPECHWLSATLGRALIHHVWLPAYNMAPPVFCFSVVFP